MIDCQTAFDSHNRIVVPSSRFDTVIGWLLAILLSFMPLAFGVVHAWSEEIVIALSGTIVLCFLLKLMYHRREGIIWTWAYIPIGIFLFIAVFQLTSLPASLINRLSPNTVIIKTELLNDLPDADTLLGSMTLSFYPNATKHDLRLVISVAAAFVVVLNVFRRPDQIKRLLMTIAIIGGVIALIALAHNLFGNGKIYWFISSKNSKGYSGPFVNHSNYGQFINLSIGAAFGWICVKLHEDFSGKKITPLVAFEYFSSASAKTFWLLAAIITLGITTVFISLTRGGIVSMLIALTVTTLLLSWRRSLKGHGWIMVVIALVAFTCILYTGFDAVYNRLATFRNFHEAESGRLQILKDIAVVCSKFPLFGTGLGTHSVVYPMFDRSTIVAIAAHADNEYAQAVEETGLVGLGILIIFGIIIWLNYARGIRNTDVPICSAAYGLGFGIIAILIHSLSDFGQHLPANAFLSAIFCALLVGLSRQRNDQTLAAQIIIPFRKLKYVHLVVLLCVLGIWLWALIGVNNSRIAEARWRKVLNIEKSFIAKNWRQTNAEYAELISQAAAASAYDKENINYRYWLNFYRWRSVSQVTDPKTGIIVVPENSLSTVYDIASQFNKARAICPTYGSTYSIVGQIEKFILNDNRGAEKIRKGFRLAPCDPIACFAAACLDISEGDDEDCIEKFNRAVQLDETLFKNVVDIYVQHLSRPHLALSAAGDDIDRLNYLVSVFEDMQYNDLAEQTQKKIKDLLEKKCSQANAPASVFESLAKIYTRQRNNNTAIEYYRRALALDYSQVNWRLSLARLLAEENLIPEAMREAKICLRLRPGLKEAEELLEDLSVRPAAFAEKVKSP